MNWILRKSKKFRYHTDLRIVLKPIIDEIKDFNWLLSDLDYMADTSDIPINFEHDYFLLSNEDFDKILTIDIQIIWGVIIGIPKKYDLKIDETKIPYSEGNDGIWEDDVFQHENAEIEIVCWDSSYTIVKFRNQLLSDKFRAFFPEAKKLATLTTTPFPIAIH